MIRKQILFDLVIIFLIGLLPALWLKDSTVILGHDSGLAIDPVIHFLDRIYVWSQRFSIGTDQNGALLGAFFIHGIEALLPWLGFNLHQSQIIQFIFWFTLPGLAMYFFAYKSFPERKYLPILASVIYMLNYYLLQGWFVAERTKFSLYIAFPLVLYFLISYLTGKTSLIRSLLFAGLILGIFNGGGSFPLYGGMGFAFLIIIAYVWFINFNSVTLKRIIFFVVGIGVIYVLLNAYWLIPYFFYISGFFSRDLANAGGVEGALTWAGYLSAHSSFINLFRGQGIPDWYLNVYHAYASNFFRNPILIAISFSFPILAVTPIILKKTSKETFMILLAVLILLVGLVFSSGPESQFGFIFELMVRYVPGFAMFRSAFFKFNYMVWFSYAILIGFTLDVILSQFKFKIKTFNFSRILLIALIFGYILYHYPVLNGSFFDYSSEPGKELTTRVTIPGYIYDFSKWVDKENPNERFLVMPQLGEVSYISYKWRYWSLAPVNSLFSRNSFVHNTALVSESEKILMTEMYAAFLKGDFDSFKDFTDVFAIDKIVVHKDYDWDNPTWGTVDPRKYEQILNDNPQLFTFEKSFGPWEVYKLNSRKKSIRVNSSSKLSYISGKLGKVVSFPYFNPKSTVFLSNIEQHKDYYAENATDIYLAPECIQCDLEYKEGTFRYFNPKLLPGSFFYPLIMFQENRVKNASTDFGSQVNYYITTTNRRIIETKWMLDSRNGLDQVLPNIERYKEGLIQLKLLLHKDEWYPSAFDENKTAQMILNHIIQQVNLIDETYKSELMAFFQKRALAEAYNQILEIEKLASAKAWVTEDMTNKKYIYDLPVTGDYEIFVKKGSLTNPNVDASSSEISFKDSNIKLAPIASVSGWLSFGKYNFNNKKAFIAIKDGTLVNLVDQAKLVYEEGNAGIIRNENNFTLTADSLNKCFYYQFKDLEFLNTQYVVTFKYRNFSDKNTLSFFNQAENENVLRYSIRDTELESTRFFKKFTKLITPKDGNLRLYFCNGFLSLSEIQGIKSQREIGYFESGQTLVEIEDITFHKVGYPNLLLYKKQKDTDDVDVVKSFIKSDPVTYKIQLAEANKPVSLIMRESYGKYWKLCGDQNKCLSFDDKAHFSAGGFANAWYLKDANLGKNLTLYYYPQRWYKIGTIITLVAFASFSIIIGWILWLSKFRKK